MKRITVLFFIIPILVFGCNQRIDRGNGNGTAWAAGSFDSNGKGIYFTATSSYGNSISYAGGPEIGMMMMGGRLACVSCHGTDARGGKHIMHMEVMNAPDIRWSVLSSDHHDEVEAKDTNDSNYKGYDLEDFRNAVEHGEHPDGEKLNMDMPRWQMNDADLNDLMTYLKSL